MISKRIEEFNAAYSENDIDKCVSDLFWLMMEYNTNIRNGKLYDHDLKHILFKANCIHNPIGMQYTKKDYEKTMDIMNQAINIATAINNPKIDTSDLIQDGIKIDDRIIEDIHNVLAYTECFYNINDTNSKRMDACEAGKVPFIEQLISLVLFHQDQIRLVRENYDNDLNKGYHTGMELAIANRPVQYYKNVKVSVSDNFESLLEGINQVVNYLYYRFGKSLNERIEVTDILTELIHPYENVEFEQYVYIASQRYFICRMEEGIRYGYYKLGEICKTKEGNRSFAFAIENDEKSKARSMGIFRRECQVRQIVVIDPRNTQDLLAGNKKITTLSDELVKVQAENFIVFSFSQFHPDKVLFLEAEKKDNIKERIVNLLTKDYYLDCEVKNIKIRDMIITYKFLDTLAEILYEASKKCINENKQETLIKEISIVDIDYLAEELARMHDFDVNYATKLIDRFIFHEKNNRYDDVFAQPLLKISKTQVIMSQALIDQVNLDRAIERQFIRYKKNVAEVGHLFEQRFIHKLTRGYKKEFLDSKYNKIPNFQVNTNEIKYIAFDGKEIEFDVVSVLGNYLILTELKAIMTSYDLNDLEERKNNIKKAIKQLLRRKESIRYDWDKLKALTSIELPDKPYDDAHIILIACTDAYDYTPLKIDEVFITDESSYLKYFTNPYIACAIQQGSVTIQNLKSLWKRGYPEAREFMEYLMNPISILPYKDALKKKWVPMPVMDENDCAIFCEEYELSEDPIMTAYETIKKEKKGKKIYPNDPCPCGSGKKYKKCCGKS